MPDLISWIVIIICIVGSFFFSACETALSCCNKYQMRAEADEGVKSSKLVVKSLNKFDRTLTTVLIGNNVVAVIISSVSALLFYKYFSAIGLEQFSSILSSVIMTVVVYILGDTLPKTIAKAIPNPICKVFIYPLYFFNIIFFPIAMIFEGLVKLIEKIFKVKQEDELTEEKFESTVEQLSNEGHIEEEVGDIIQSALEFDDTSVKEVFTPLKNMFAIDISKVKNEEINKLLIENKKTRIPIYNKDYSHFIGVLNAKLYVKNYVDNPNFDIKRILQKVYYVDNKIKLDDLLVFFKSNKTHIALVTDNNNEVIGMVTMEDALEELVSDISEPNQIKRAQ
mgnify:CR=1 FL=1